MAKKSYPIVEVTLEKIVGGGQTLGTLEDGRKVFVWGALPDEHAKVQLTKKKSKYAEAVISEVLTASSDRIEPIDPESYLSTSPWQVMSFDAEQRYKAALIEEAFELHNIVLPDVIDVYSDGKTTAYRNKIEFSFWYDAESDSLSLAFFRRGSHGRIAVPGTSLAHPAINKKGNEILSVLNKLKVDGRTLKTLLIRSSQSGEVAWQLYVKDEKFNVDALFNELSPGQQGEVIFSNPQSPASVITNRLTPPADVLTDTVLGVPFRYATEGFFQINIPVYEQALRDMKQWIPEGQATVDMYSGVGSIGLTIGGDNTTLVELNEHAVREMQQNIKDLGSNAMPILAASENALDYIVGEKLIIVDPPRAGLHEAVVARLLEEKPQRIVYLSCNPVTQARDVERLATEYGIKAHRGYNLFPRTPHIEHLVVLDRKDAS